ncbi:MAG: hypothetical protein WD052_14360 [Bacteroidales bacterium]
MEEFDIVPRFRDADQRFILGYGFHDFSMKALQMDCIGEPVFCTAFRLSEKEIGQVKSKYGQNYNLMKEKNLDLLKIYFDLS